MLAGSFSDCGCAPHHAAEHLRGPGGLPESHPPSHPTGAAVHGHGEFHHGHGQGGRESSGMP